MKLNFYVTYSDGIERMIQIILISITYTYMYMSICMHYIEYMSLESRIRIHLSSDFVPLFSIDIDEQYFLNSQQKCMHATSNITSARRRDVLMSA